MIIRVALIIVAIAAAFQELYYVSGALVLCVIGAAVLGK